jgi:RNA polymerase subunit RPABC4/transcription elongation factor Spt4
MKAIATCLLALPLCGCEDAPRTGNDDISTEWIGHTLVIKRKGLEIAKIKNVSNAFFVEVSGTDGAPDLMIDYFEDDASGLAPVPTRVARAVYSDSGVSLVTYDENGRVTEESTIDLPIQESEQAGSGQPATRSDSDLKDSDKPQPEAEERSR